MTQNVVAAPDYFLVPSARIVELGTRAWDCVLPLNEGKIGLITLSVKLRYRRQRKILPLTLICLVLRRGAEATSPGAREPARRSRARSKLAMLTERKQACGHYQWCRDGRTLTRMQASARGQRSAQPI